MTTFNELAKKIQAVKREMLQYIKDVCGTSTYNDVYRKYQFPLRYKGDNNPVYIKCISGEFVSLIDSYNTISKDVYIEALSLQEIIMIAEHIKEIKYICEKE